MRDLDYDITFSLVLYKTKSSLVRRLSDCLAKIKLKNKIVVIDNSGDSDCKSLFQNLRSVEYVHSQKNIGYGKAHNIALRKVLLISKYHLILNPDIFFEEGVIENIVAFLEENVDVGLLMPKVVYPNGSIQHLCKFIPSPLDLISRRFIPLKFLVKKKYDFEFKFAGYGQILDVPYLSGCFMCIRTSVLQDVGFFDERFFMYAEDMDLSRRINEKYRTIYYPQVEIVHDHARESYKSLKMLFIHIVNVIRYFNKWGWVFDKKRVAQNRKSLEKYLMQNATDQNFKNKG